MVAVGVGFAIFTVVFGANALGLRVSSGFQLALSAVLVGVITVAVAVALPSRATHNWTPFAPHGWWAIGTAANILMWLFFGWEAMAQLAGDFRDPRHDLPRAVALAFVIVAVLYVGSGGGDDRCHWGRRLARAARGPDRRRLRSGWAGRDSGARGRADDGDHERLYGGSAKLAASLAQGGGLPRWLGGDADRSVPRRPLAALAVTTAIILAALVVGLISATALVRATSACFILVYVLALASAVRISSGALRAAAIVALALVCVVGVFSSWYLFVPAVAALLSVCLRDTGARKVHRLPDQPDETAARPVPVAPVAGDQAPLQP